MLNSYGVETIEQGPGIPAAYKDPDNLARLRAAFDVGYQHYRREGNLWGKSVQIEYLQTIFHKRSLANAVFMVWYGKDCPSLPMIRTLRKVWGVEKVQQIFATGGSS